MAISIFRTNNYSDKQIVEGIQAGKERMVQHLQTRCRAYFDDNYRVLFVAIADVKEEIFEECFVKLWTDIENHRIHIGEDGEVWRINKKGEDRKMTTRLHTFLLDIAKNVYRVWLRKHKDPFIGDIYSSHNADDDEGALWEEKISSAETIWDNTDNVVTSESSFFEQALSDDKSDQSGLVQELVQEAVMNLSQTCKEILTMFYYEGLSLDEILVRRGENSSKDGLKTGKHKCMKRFEADVRNKFARYRIKY